MVHLLPLTKIWINLSLFLGYFLVQHAHDAGLPIQTFTLKKLDVCGSVLRILVLWLLKVKPVKEFSPINGPKTAPAPSAASQRKKERKKPPTSLFFPFFIPQVTMFPARPTPSN